MERTAHKTAAASEDKGAAAAVAQSDQIRFQFLHRFSELRTGQVTTLPASGAKQHLFGSLPVAAAVEQRIQSLSAQYLMHAKGICRSLSVRDIIFPFHYFW